MNKPFATKSTASLSAPEGKRSLKILSDLQKAGIVSWKTSAVELKKMTTRRKSAKTKPTTTSMSTYELDSQNACVLSGKGKLNVVMPKKMDSGIGKETKKRRAFDDVGNKNQTLLSHQIGSKKSRIQFPSKSGSVTFATKEFGKENSGIGKIYKISDENQRSSGEVPVQVKLKTKQVAMVKVRPSNREDILKSGIENIPIPKTRSYVYGEENLDLTNLARAIDNLISEPPEGVVDIDEICKDYFYCPDVAREIIAYLMEKEMTYRVSSSYLVEDPEVNANMRSILIDWLIQVQTHLNLNHHTLHLTVALIDLYLMKKRTRLSKLQLVGVTCLLVSSKVEERFAPCIDKLVHLTDNTYTFNNVIQTELIVLRVLGFCIHPPVATEFLDRYLMCLPIDNDLEHLCRYLLDLALPDSNSMDFVPSLRAAAAIYLGCMALPNVREDMEKRWTDELQFYTGYTEMDLSKCAKRFARLVLKAPKSKFQGAREKYGQQCFKAISHFQCLCDPIIQSYAMGNPGSKIQ